jgi:ribonuclease G
MRDDARMTERGDSPAPVRETPDSETAFPGPSANLPPGPAIVKEILIDCGPVQTRVALTENGKPAELLLERARRQGSVGDIYLGRVSRVLPGMQAAFVDIGLEKDSFLYVADVRDEWEDEDDLVEDEPRPRPATSIDDLLKEGQDIVVQVVKEPIGAKGARVSTNISLPGRLLVSTPFSARVGISRRIESEEERERLKAMLEGFRADGGFIARTAAQGRAPEEFENDRTYLEALWRSIQTRARSSRPPALLHREQDLLLRALRDLLSPEISAIRVNDHEAFGRVVEFVNAMEPSLVSRARLHKASALFFEEFGIEAEIEKAIKSKVWLKSGGYLVINPTEALVSIDVNSGKFVGKDSLEETVLAVNLEAVREIVRQIRLRDLGGILVVDFIDLEDAAHRQQLFDAFETEMKKDRAKSKILQISEFGLVQITRKRSRASLDRALTKPCPSCGGNGRIKNDFTVGLEIRREIVKMARSFSAGETILVRATPDVARLLRDEETGILETVERELEISVVLREDDTMAPAQYEIAIL